MNHLSFSIALFFWTSLGCSQTGVSVDLLLINGQVLDGAGNPWSYQDVGITGDKITFVGDSDIARVSARQTLDIKGLLLTPGFWDVHSHARLDSPGGKSAVPQLYQGITTLVMGVDGGGPNNIAAIAEGYQSNGIAVNAVSYVGHAAARRAVMGLADRAPTPEEMERMKDYITQGMEEGAVGLSTGLYYSPGTFATTEEVIALARVAAKYGGSYDTHDRDLGVAYKGIGYLASIQETIEIAETAGIPAIFSHFNAQGPKNYGRAPEGALLIEEARSRGVNVMAGQHVYTASTCSLVACALPRWAAEGGENKLKSRLRDPDIREKLQIEIAEMVELVGGADKLLFTDPRQELLGRTLGDVSRDWQLPISETVMKILATGNARVINHDLYDSNNTDFLAQQEWMMTCTDGGTPTFGEGIVHPRTYGAFTRKLRDIVYNRKIVSLPFAVRGMTSLAANFYGFSKRGLIKEGFYADVAVFDETQIQDIATFDDPHRYSEGTVHVIVNGKIAFRNGAPTNAHAGRHLDRVN